MDKTAKFLQILVDVVDAHHAAQNFGPVIPGNLSDRMDRYTQALDLFNDFCAEELPAESLAAVRGLFALIEKRDLYGNRPKLFKEYLDMADK